MLANRLFSAAGGGASSALIVSAQQVSISITGSNTSATASITAVDLSRSVVFFLGSSVTGASEQHFSRVALTNSTTVTATRDASTTGYTTTVNAVVVEFDSDYVTKVERGSITMSSTTVNHALGSSFNTNTSVAVLTGVETENGWKATPKLKITSATNLQLEVDSSSVASEPAGYAVIEFDSTKLQNSVVEYAEVNLDSTTSATATITSIDTSKTFLLLSGIKNNASATQGLPRVSLTNSTTVTATRSASSTSCRVGVYVVPISTGVSVQRGESSFGASDTSKDNAISSVNTNRAFVSFLAQTQSNAALNYGSTFPRLSLPSANVVRQERGNATRNTVTVSWEVIA